jgi:aspartyl-tRNA synthetase
MLRTHCATELRISDSGSKPTLAGWVDRRRDHGSLIFIDLRDRTGVIQIVFNPERSSVSHKVAGELRNEYVIQVSGEISLRPKGTENLKLATGQIEILADEIKILNTSETPPFYINDITIVDENLRLEYRYLDLRRENMKQNILLRHNMVRIIRNYFNERGFIDIETPILGKSTPEGARDYLVPSRVHPGEFYALPQSPQQMKQLLMVAGFEKYYQIAKCFRDEDTRADRQPEFTQLDVEMSFVSEEDVMDIIETLFTEMTIELRPGAKLIRPFPRLDYHEAISIYGCDKPDIRFGMKIGDVTSIIAASNFSVLIREIEQGGVVKGIALPQCCEYSRGQLAELTSMAQSFGARGMLSIALIGDCKLEQMTPDMVKSVAAKFFSIEQVIKIAEKTGAVPGDLIILMAGEERLVCNVLGRIRTEMGRRLQLADPNLFAYCFVVGFPLLEWNSELGRWEAVHHPFTSPVNEDIPLLETEPGRVGSRTYDIVLNGYELGSGSIRIHKDELQRKIFHLMGYTDAEIEARFGHLLKAFRFGAPPHGGIAVGIDRTAMLFSGQDTIRDVIAFPKNQQAIDLLFGSPARVSPSQLKELSINIAHEPKGEQ